MKNRKYSAKAVALDLAKILVGSLIAAAGFQYFMYPNSIPSGSMTGVGQIINLLIHVPVGVITILLNIPLFAIVWKKLGRRFVVYSLICMLAVSVFIDLLALIPLQATSDSMLAAVYGGVLYGAGYGLVYTTGATGGGIDIPAKLLRMKYAYINFGMISMAIQGCIILAFALVFRKIESCMYAIICSFITNKIVDLMLYGPATSRQCYIISERSDELRRAIVNQLGSGGTLLEGKGAWSGQDKQVILCVIRPRQITALRRLVRTTDQKAFFIISDARCVYGKGFESLEDDD